MDKFRGKNYKKKIKKYSLRRINLNQIFINCVNDSTSLKKDFFFFFFNKNYLPGLEIKWPFCVINTQMEKTLTDIDWSVKGK